MPLFQPPGPDTSDADAFADDIALTRVDDAGAVPRPSHLGPFHVETEYDELEAEQPPLWDAEGVSQSRGPSVSAAGGALAARTAEKNLLGHHTLLETTQALYKNVLEALSSYRRRPQKAKRWHLAAKAAFLLGDLAGIATAAIWMGEIPAIALVMAVSAAAATVTAGLSGAEVRDLRNRIRRARDASELPSGVASYAHLFEAPDKGWPFVKSLVYVSLAVAGIIALAIFGLRTSIEGPLVGIVYGGIAAAIAAASWIESYMYADDIADLIDNAEADYVRELTRNTTLSVAASWREHAEATAEADSITKEHDLRGEAAAAHLRALKARVLRRNPGVAGHGVAVEPPAIGQTARRGGAK